MLRLHLPPNFNAAVVRNAVPLRVEVDLNSAPPPELLPVLAVLQRLCGTATPPKFIQLNRAQLREVAAVAGSQPIFVENGKLTSWNYNSLLGNADATAQSATLNSNAAAAPIRNPKSAFRNRTTPVTIDGSEHFLAITLPSREDPQYDAAVALLKENGFTLEPSNRKWWLRDRHKVLNFLAGHVRELRDRFAAEFTANFEKNTARIRPAEITAGVDATGERFSVEVGVRAGDTDPSVLRSAMAANRGYVETGGTIYLLDHAQLEKLGATQRALAGDPNAAIVPQRTMAVSPARVAEVQELLEQLSPNFRPPEAWRTRSTALHNLTALTPAPVPPELEAQLRPYQRLGTAWLWHLYRHELGGILADEMGLGKTLQALALLAARSAVSSPIKGEGVRSKVHDRSVRLAQPSNLTPSTLNSSGPSLVVCPASLLENWRREALRFAPQLRVFVHHGEQRLRRSEHFSGCDLAITSYGTLTRDQELFASVEFACVIADEAQHIKNRRSQNAAALRSLNARSRFLLTGTPVENSLEDLRSLFEFLLPGYLTRVPAGIRGDERRWYDDRLRAQTALYILRRTKKTVAPELPDKIEQVLWCELTSTQAALYREFQERSERELIDLEASGASEAKLKFAALTQLLRLRQICCDPRLVGGADEPFKDQGVRFKQTTDLPNSAERSLNLKPSPLNAESGARSAPDSAKLDAFRELLEEAIDDGHRVLVFSQFTSLLALLRTELDGGGINYCYLDGSMAARARQAEVDRFQKSDEIPLFLLSLKAGGTGLNLTGADTVVIFDPWWNPAVEAQAMDRAHRIGQTRTVTTYKLIAANTVEEKVLGLQMEKRALLANVFEASDAATANLSLGELKELLRV